MNGTEAKAEMLAGLVPRSRSGNPHQASTIQIDRPCCGPQNVGHSTGGQARPLESMQRRSTSSLDRAVSGLSADTITPRPKPSESIKLRVTPEQKEQIHSVADELEMAVSDLIVQVVEHALPRLTKTKRT